MFTNTEEDKKKEAGTRSGFLDSQNLARELMGKDFSQTPATSVTSTVIDKVSAASKPVEDTVTPETPTVTPTVAQNAPTSVPQQTSPEVNADVQPSPQNASQPFQGASIPSTIVAPTEEEQAENTRMTAIQDASKGMKPDENGIITIPGSLGLAKKSNFAFTDRTAGDYDGLKDGLFVAGLTMLVGAAAGLDSEDIMLAGWMSGTRSFSDTMNRSARYKNLQELQDQGYDDTSIEEYITHGNIDVLKKREVDPWKQMGDGRFMRQMEDGSLQIMGEAKKTAFSTDEERHGDKLVTVVRAQDGTILSTNSRHSPVAPRSGPKASRNITNVVYEDKDGVNYKVTTYSDGSSMREQLLDKPFSATEAKLQAEKDASKANATAAYETAGSTMTLVTDLLGRDLDSVTGFVDSLTPTFKESTKGTIQAFGQLFNKQFLENISAMKGMGALSNAEGSKISGAATFLVDPETGKLKEGLAKADVIAQLQTVYAVSLKGQLAARFMQEYGREPTIDESNEMMREANEQTADFFSGYNTPTPSGRKSSGSSTSTGQFKSKGGINFTVTPDA